MVAFRPRADQVRHRQPRHSLPGDANILSRPPRFHPSAATAEMSITLTENANLSTFLHETGHFYLEMMGDLAEDPAADQQVKDDYAALLGWLGVKSRAEIAVEHHEKFARANEAYLMEGNAPAPELRGVFQRFKAWLVGVYRDIANLDVKLNDDVRAVFDRIYATDQEIEAAKARGRRVLPVPGRSGGGRQRRNSPPTPGRLKKGVRGSAGNPDAPADGGVPAGQRAWWKNERAKTLEEVTAEVDAQPVYRAFAALVAGKMDDRTPVKAGSGRHRAALRRGHAEAVAAWIPAHLRQRGRAGHRHGGRDVRIPVRRGHAEILPGDAPAQGTDSGRDGCPDAGTPWRPDDRWSDRGSGPDALHNAAGRCAGDGTSRPESQDPGGDAGRPLRAAEGPAGAARERRGIGRPAFPRHVPPGRGGHDRRHGCAGHSPHAYLLAGRKAARSGGGPARDQAGDAFSAKQRELLNHYLYLEAVKAREPRPMPCATTPRPSRVRRSAKLGKAGHDYSSTRPKPCWTASSSPGSA